MNLIGSEGNVATLPFYKAMDIADYEPYNNDGNTNNTPKEISGGKQTAMLIQRMMAWKAQDFTKELTGADPMQHIANSVSDYYRQVWEAELMNIVNGGHGAGFDERPCIQHRPFGGEQRTGCQQD